MTFSKNSKDVDRKDPQPTRVLPFVPANQQPAIVVEKRGTTLKVSLTNRILRLLRKDRP